MISLRGAVLCLYTIVCKHDAYGILPMNLSLLALVILQSLRLYILHTLKISANKKKPSNYFLEKHYFEF